MPARSTNASANPAAIFLPNVHMSQLLGAAIRTATALNEIDKLGGRDDAADQALSSHDVPDVLVRCVLRGGFIDVRHGNAEIAFEATEGEADRLRTAAEDEPARLLLRPAIAE